MGAHDGSSAEILRMASGAHGVTNRQVQERFGLTPKKASSKLAIMVIAGQLVKVKPAGQRTRFFSSNAQAIAWSAKQGEACANPPQDATHDLLRKTIDGPEKFCKKCSEWWPADSEFWHADKDGAGGLFYCCRACYFEWRTGRRAGGLSHAAGAAGS